MKSAYVDTSAIIQVIGCTLKYPSLLEETDRYVIRQDDFVEEFHKIVFGSINNIYLTGSTVTIPAILDYLENRPKFNAIFKKHNGKEYLIKVSEAANLETFNYYYLRLKKMSLFRAYEKIGMNLEDLYDPNNVLDIQKKQRQENWLDKTSLEEIAKIIDDKIEEIKYNHIAGENGICSQAGEKIDELIEDLKINPEIGIPMYGPLINTITRGARLKKFYLRSAPTGLGKTRTLVADACNFACNQIYDNTYGWINNGESNATLFIATEQDRAEIQTLMLAFLSNVNEDHILTGRYEDGEEDRVKHAAEILKNSPLWIEELPDFSIQDVENKIKKNIRDNNILFVCFDYIHSSMKILEEITRRSGGIRLREDNVLFILSTQLKNICNKYGIFILSSTQLNGEWMSTDTPNQNLLRGAKSIADKIDVGMIMLDVTPTDLEKLSTVLELNDLDKPVIKISIYKNRRGSFSGVYLWCRADLGTCRVQPMFCTNYNHELVQLKELYIRTELKSAF